MPVFWLELHCENTDDQSDDCVGHRHDYIMGGTGSPGARAKVLVKEARSKGWRTMVDVGFCCPACVKHLKGIRRAQGN